MMRRKYILIALILVSVVRCSFPSKDLAYEDGEVIEHPVGFSFQKPNGSTVQVAETGDFAAPPFENPHGILHILGPASVDGPVYEIWGSLYVEAEVTYYKNGEVIELSDGSSGWKRRSQDENDEVSVHVWVPEGEKLFLFSFITDTSQPDSVMDEFDRFLASLNIR